MGGQPLLDFGGLVDLGVVGDDGEVSKERRRVGAIKRLQQVKEKPGLLTLPHTRGEGAGSRGQRPGQIALLVSARRQHFDLGSLGHPLRADLG